MTEKRTLNIRMDKIYTRSGDAGKTRLIGGKTLFKDDARIEAYGTVDELNAEIGLCRELLIDLNNEKLNSLIRTLRIVQNELYNLGTQLAINKEDESDTLPQLSDACISKLESEIDTANNSLSTLKSFVLPGGSKINAQFHIARNVCRRAERRTVTLSKIEKVDPINLKYLNRLSDALFVWSRWISSILKHEEILWTPNF